MDVGEETNGGITNGTGEGKGGDRQNKCRYRNRWKSVNERTDVAEKGTDRNYSNV